MMSFLLSEDKFRLEYLNACLYSTCVPFIPDEKTKRTQKS